jgi:hypothetical protein
MDATRLGFARADQRAHVPPIELPTMGALSTPFAPTPDIKTDGVPIACDWTEARNVRRFADVCVARRVHTAPPPKRPTRVGQGEQP